MKINKELMKSLTEYIWKERKENADSGGIWTYAISMTVGY
jgi:hypothetical protein